MRALVVDDSRFMRLWMCRTMTRRGWTCAEAEDGEQALQMLGSDSAQFELLLMDVNMPVMSGLCALRALHSSGTRPPGLRVMMVTTEADTDFIATALELGADEFLMKPATEEGLSSKLQLLGLADEAA